MSREALLAIMVLTAPWAIVLVVAILRGYSVHVHIQHHTRRRDE